MRGSLLLAGLLLLGGCSHIAYFPPAALPAQIESAPFVVNGRISVDHQGERHSSGLYWTHKPDSDEVLLVNPFGQAVARVYRDDKYATLDEGGKRYMDIDAESLMDQVLGWQLPLEDLHHWVLGRANGGSPAQIERGKDGRISVLHQDGWEVRYLAYADDTPQSMPARLQLSHEDLQVKLLIDAWNWEVR